MAAEEPMYAVLEFILNRASSAELEVIAEALNRRRSQSTGLGGINPRGMAENVAARVKEQLGGMLDVRSISRQIVTDLIRQKEPNISDRELEVLLNNWLPGSVSGSPGQPEQTQPQQGEHGDRIPPDVMITMVSQYVAARQGTLDPKELEELPKNWQVRFWEAFPDVVRASIREHLNGRMTDVEFWDSVISSLDR